MKEAEDAILNVVIRSLRSTLVDDMPPKTADQIVREAINALQAMKELV